jgi:hypothetical protein
MKSLSARFAVIVTASTMLAGMWLLATSRLEYCGLTPVPPSRTEIVTASPAPAPTLAPPQEVVFVRIEADKADLQVGWAENWQSYRQLTNQ